MSFLLPVLCCLYVFPSQFASFSWSPHSLAYTFDLFLPLGPRCVVFFISFLSRWVLASGCRHVMLLCRRVAPRCRQMASRCRRVGGVGLASGGVSPSLSGTGVSWTRLPGAESDAFPSNDGELDLSWLGGVALEVELDRRRLGAVAHESVTGQAVFADELSTRDGIT